MTALRTMGVDVRRWQQDLHVSKREWKKHHNDHVEQNKRDNSRVGKDPYEVECPCDNQLGRFRKKDAYDCGIPRCPICHYNKYPKRELHEHEVKSNTSFKEQLKEINTQPPGGDVF